MNNAAKEKAFNEAFPPNAQVWFPNESMRDFVMRVFDIGWNAANSHNKPNCQFCGSPADAVHQMAVFYSCAPCRSKKQPCT